MSSPVRCAINYDGHDMLQDVSHGRSTAQAVSRVGHTCYDQWAQLHLQYSEADLTSLTPLTQEPSAPAFDITVSDPTKQGDGVGVRLADPRQGHQVAAQR